MSTPTPCSPRPWPGSGCHHRVGVGRRLWRVSADKGYSTQAIRGHLRQRHITPRSPYAAISRPTVAVGAVLVVVHRPSIGLRTGAAMWSNAASSRSSSIGPSPPDATRPRFVTEACSIRPPCSYGFEDVSRRLAIGQLGWTTMTGQSACCMSQLLVEPRSRPRKPPRPRLPTTTSCACFDHSFRRSRGPVG